MSVFEKRLIEATKRRKEIYNPANKSNRYVKSKTQAWTEIAQELGVPVNKCRARWTSLRDRFRVISKARQKALQNGVKPVIKWRYYKALEFLSDTSPANANSESKDSLIIPEFEVETIFPTKQFSEVDCTPCHTKDRLHEEPTNTYNTRSTTDLFFISLARRIKTANLPPLTQMKLEADILNFTINQLEEIDNT